jgi:hypothetical protein
VGYKVVYEFDPFELTGVDKPDSRKDKSQAMRDIAEYVRDEILQYVGDGSSPVSGRGKFKALSPEYKKIKEEISGVGFSNMELYGDMLDSLEIRITGNKIAVGWFGGDEAAKADGHNNFSGDSSLPVRRSIPNAKDGETFKRDIVKGMKEIAKEFLPED